jgi:hypothetical protein
MSEQNEWTTTPEDLAILRSLAQRKAEIAHDPVNRERREAWYVLDAGTAKRPMILAEGGVAFEDLPESELQCREDWARGLEHDLRFEIFQFERLQDDHVVEPFINCNWRVEQSDYGVSSKQEYAERVSGNVSSRHWDPPIKDLDRDFEKLHPRTYSVDRPASLAWKAHLEQVFDGVLAVRMRGSFWWTTGLTIVAIDLVGLEQLMTLMCMNPNGVHRLMAFLRDDHLAFAEWLEKEGLLSLNNENDYIGSGSMGYSHALPAPDAEEGNPVRLNDLWVLSESQETSSVSTAMFDEFVFQYQRPILERFGRTYYGCCEPVHLRWDVLKRIPNLQRVSVAPWCDQAQMAEALGQDYVFSRKPNPTLVSTTSFDEDLIRKDLRATLSAASGCNLEIILKDVHTLAGQPERMLRWVELAREESGTAY